MGKPHNLRLAWAAIGNMLIYLNATNSKPNLILGAGYWDDGEKRSKKKGSGLTTTPPPLALDANYGLAG